MQYKTNKTTTHHLSSQPQSTTQTLQLGHRTQRKKSPGTRKDILTITTARLH